MENIGTEILKWYKGKALANAVAAVVSLRASAKLGYWVKGTSRGVRAALSKTNVAAKIRKSHPEVYDDYQHPLHGVLVDMYFGSFVRAPLRVVELLTVDACGERVLYQKAMQWARDFAPIAELVALLDSRRPVPVVVCKTLSPWVVENLAGKLGLALDTVEVPPTRGEWRKVTRPIKGDRHGRTETVEVWHQWIDWPEGTRHNRSRFCDGSDAGNSQCHACGHAIKAWWNWVPLVVREADGLPSSLWVGHDCASKLLECEIDAGETCYFERSGSVGTAP